MKSENISILEREVLKESVDSFNEHEVIHTLKHYLPSQAPLKDFIHHNSLHAFQQMDFYEAIFTASEIFGFKVTFTIDEYRQLYEIGRIRKDVLERIIKDKKGESSVELWRQNLLNKKYESLTIPRVGRLRANWKKLYKIDLDNLVQPLLFRVLCSYLDQGIALWHFPFEDRGLLNAVRELEKNSFASFFKTKRARALLFEENISIKKLLKIVVGDESYYEQYLFDQQFSHRGWSGMASAIEDNPQVLLYKKKIELHDTIVFELLLEIDALDDTLGDHWKPLCSEISEPPINLMTETRFTELHEVLVLWQDAFEWSYYDEVLAAVDHLQKNRSVIKSESKSFQAVFCLDERECSLRRHVEAIDPACETYGCPGFFGVEFYFQPHNGKFYEKLCPAPVTPKFLIKETDVREKRKSELFYTKKSHTFFRGSVMSLPMGAWAALRLFLNIFRPQMSPAISDAFALMHINGKLIIENKGLARENDLQVGFTVKEMAVRVENLLKGIGMVKDFAPLVYLVGHGSSSANNPHHGAHDCGACSGRPGSVNARVFAFMANHKEVRKILYTAGIDIPLGTQFIGALHDTASDKVMFYDEDILSERNLIQHPKSKDKFEHALDLNAKERSRRFASINTRRPIKHVREAIRKRSVSFFEPRPELGHGTNALCFVGNRSLTKGLFLDRRAFMNSYDYRTDPDGSVLLNVIKPLPPVCGGINLEYYFSRIDNKKLGAGTKLPHNVMGLIGVANSSDGDLRPGLPLQMIEVHDPVRLLIAVEHYPDVILNTIKALPDLYEWFSKRWIHLIAIHPDTNEFYYFKNDGFYLHVPMTGELKYTTDIHTLIETAKEMETNYITDATRENLPVHVIK